jgi:collagenase-like PrtC family protease
MKNIYWHLPGFCYFKTLNLTLLDLMKKYPHSFREGYCVGSVYGTFPGAIWNGGRTVLGFTSKNDVERTVKEYNSRNVPLRFTWTNPLIGEDETKDTLCNLIMSLAQNGMNQVLVNSPVLEDYLREKYPDYKYVSSTTKRIVDSDALQNELKKDYFMVVLDYDLNHDEEVLKSLEPEAPRVEILVDEICFPHCPKRLEHYRDEAEKQLQYEIAPPFDCPNRQQKKSFDDCKNRPAFISKEDITGYIDRGFENFKLVGRGLPINVVLDSYIYYLVKDEEQDFIRREITKALQDAAMKKAAPRR